MALTFDDGPHPEWTPVVLDALDEFGIKATFFVNGFRVDMHPELAAEIVRRGHSLQNHTFGHNRLIELSDYGVTRDIARGEESIRAATGTEPTCLRPPWGESNGRVRSAAAQEGERVVMWTIDTLDWLHRSPERTVAAVAAELEPGAVILLHDSLGWVTRDALRGIVVAVRGAGLEFDTICDERSDHLPIADPGRWARQAC